MARTLTPGDPERGEHLGGDARACPPCRRPPRRESPGRDRCRRSGSGLPRARARTRVRTTAAARSACSCGIAQQIECSELPCEMRMTEMPSSRSAPNSRCAVPGTPIMPVPSRLTSATRSMLVMPFTGRSEAGCGADQRADLLGREGVADPDGDAALDRRRHGLRMDDLGAEVRELHRLVVGERVDHRGIGHAARIGRQHAVDVGPDVDLAGREQRAEDRGGEVAAVAAERGRHAAPVDGDEAGDDQRAVKVRRHLGARCWRATPATALPGPERPPLHHHHAPRIEPGHRPGAARALLEKRLEQPRRPDLAVAGDQVADAARRGARVVQRARAVQRAQRLLDVAAVAVEGGPVVLAPPPGSAARRRSPHAARAAAAALAATRSSLRSASATMRSSASVTPRQADSTTPRRPGGAASRMAATLRKQSASATLDPPNLCTTQGSGLTIELDLSGVKGACDSTDAPAAAQRRRVRRRRRASTACAHGRDWHNRPPWKPPSVLCCPCSSASVPPGARSRSACSRTPRGSTYRKPGALILIAADGDYAGLISGGCLEGDLREHARAVIATGAAREVRYDMRGSDDLLWGLGLGCEGAMQILLLRAGPDNDWQPLDASRRRPRRACGRPRSVWWRIVRRRAAPAAASPCPRPARQERGRARSAAGGAAALRARRRERRMRLAGAARLAAVRRCRSRCRRASCCSAPDPTPRRWWTSPRGSAGRSRWPTIAPPTRSRRTFLPPSGCCWRPPESCARCSSCSAIAPRSS